MDNIPESAQTQNENFKVVLNDILNMGYFKNSAVESGHPNGFDKHEQAIRNVFENHGYTPFEPTERPSKNDVENWITNPETCPLRPGQFLEQPCGSQGNPDFLVRVSNDLLLPIEAKSSQKGTPLYNSGGVKNRTLYIFCSEHHNQTTIFWGSDIITPEQQETLREIHRLQKDIEILKNQLLQEQDTNGRGWSYYTRPMIGQCGGREKTDYFTHNDRRRCEENVLNYFNQASRSLTAEEARSIVG